MEKTKTGCRLLRIGIIVTAAVAQNGCTQQQYPCRARYDNGNVIVKHLEEPGLPEKAMTPGMEKDFTNTIQIEIMGNETSDHRFSESCRQILTINPK